MTDDPLPGTPPHEVLLHVALGGAPRDDESRGDLRVRQPLGHEPQDLDLARGQAGGRGIANEPRRLPGRSEHRADRVGGQPAGRGLGGQLRGGGLGRERRPVRTRAAGSRSSFQPARVRAGMPESGTYERS